MTGYILTDFGNPHSQKELKIFLRNFNKDHDLKESFLKKYIFQKKISSDLVSLKAEDELPPLEKKLAGPLLPFHLYLSDTHKNFLDSLAKHQEINRWIVVSKFPFFSYSLSGKIASFFLKNLDKDLLQKIFWISSYSQNELFISMYIEKLKKFLKDQNLKQEETFFIFSAYGILEKFNFKEEAYSRDCHFFVKEVTKGFPFIYSQLTFESPFKAEKIKPQTLDICQNIKAIDPKRKNVLFLFPSSLDKTFETNYVLHKVFPIIKSQNLLPFYFSPFELEDSWTDLINSIVKEENLVKNEQLAYKFLN